MLIFKNKTISIIILILALLLPNICFANSDTNLELNLTYPDLDDFNLNEDQNINEIVAWLYYFLITISGFSAFVMLIKGGFMWLSSAGNPSVLGEAKDIITSAMLGLIIVLTSFLILQVINPELTLLNIEQLQLNSPQP